MSKIDIIDSFLDKTKYFSLNKALPSIWIEKHLTSSFGESFVVHSYDYNNSIINNDTIFTQIRNVLMQKSEEIYFENVLSILVNNYSLNLKTVEKFKKMHAEMFSFKIFNNSLYGKLVYLQKPGKEILPIPLHEVKSNRFYIENYVYGHSIHNDNKKRRNLENISTFEKEIFNNILVCFAQSAVFFINELVKLVRKYVYPNSEYYKVPLNFNKDVTITEAITKEKHLSLPFFHGVCIKNNTIIFNHENGLLIKIPEFFDKKTGMRINNLYLWGPPKSFIIDYKSVYLNIDTIDRTDRFSYLLLFKPDTLSIGLFHKKPINYFEGI